MSIASSYMTRVLRLTLFATDLVEAMSDGRHGTTVTLEPSILEWETQRTKIC